MLRKMAWIVAIAAFAGAGFALADPTEQKWSGQITIGYDMPMGPPADYLNSGWSFSGGATWRPWEGPLGFRFDLAGNYFKAKTSGVRGFLEGNARIWALTAGAVYDFKIGGSVGMYVTGAIGGYRVYANLTVPSFVQGYWCDPWGWCYTDIYTTERVMWEKALYKLGYNVGAGVTFRLQDQSQLYVEVTYNWVQTSNPTEYVPIVIGWRW